MTLFRRFFTIALATSLISVASAQNLKVATVDMQELFKQYHLTIAAQDQIDVEKYKLANSYVSNMIGKPNLSGSQMKNIIEKCESAGNNKITLCERGNSFGYNNLIVDTLNFQILKNLDKPVFFDVTHSLQLPGGLGKAAGGRREFLLPLAKAGISQCIAGLFLEAHPNPDEAKCDGPCAISSEEILPVLSQLSALDEFIKTQDRDS